MQGNRCPSKPSCTCGVGKSASRDWSFWRMSRQNALLTGRPALYSTDRAASYQGWLRCPCDFDSTEIQNAMGSSVRRYPWHFEFQSYQNHMGSENFPGKLPAVHSATHGILNFSPIKITWAANFFCVSCTPTLSLILKLPDLRKAFLPVNNVKMPPLSSGS